MAQGILRRSFIVAAAALALLAAPGAQAKTAPVFEINQAGSSIKFFVKASVGVAGKFDKWDGHVTFASTNPTSGVLEIKIQAASVDTGSGLKNRKLKGSDFFDVDKYPVMLFRSKKIVQISPTQFEMDGDFTIKGVTRPEKLSFTVAGAGTGNASITGKMTFNRRHYGINGDIPFVKIADHVDVTVAMNVRRVSGPALVLH